MVYPLYTASSNEVQTTRDLCIKHYEEIFNDSKAKGLSAVEFLSLIYDESMMCTSTNRNIIRNLQGQLATALGLSRQKIQNFIEQGESLSELPYSCLLDIRAGVFWNLNTLLEELDSKESYLLSIYAK